MSEAVALKGINHPYITRKEGVLWRTTYDNFAALKYKEEIASGLIDVSVAVNDNTSQVRASALLDLDYKSTDLKNLNWNALKTKTMRTTVTFRMPRP